MAERYSFFDAQQGASGYDRTYSSADLAEYFASFVGNGVFADPATSLAVRGGGKLAVTVNPGKAWVNGYFYVLDEAKELEVARGDNNYARFDLVVCSLSMSKRLIEVKVVKGTPAANPQVPSFSRTAETYDLVLAQVSVPAGTTAITDDLVTDCRPDASKCGFVAGVVKQIDTTDLFAQYDAAFGTWFDTAKGQLSGDVAGNLSNSITALTNRVQEESEKVQPVELGGTGATTAASALAALGVKMGTSAAPATAEPNSVYIQLL